MGQDEFQNNRRMSMKKIIITITALVLLILFTGCGNNGTPSEMSTPATNATDVIEAVAPTLSINHSPPAEPTIVTPNAEPAVASPCPERRAVLLEQSGISEYGWQVAADFLSDFTSLFTRVYRARFIWDIWDETLGTVGTAVLMPLGIWDSVSQQVIVPYESLEISFVQTYGRGQGGFFDRQGNRIYDTPWAYNSHHYANYFNLFDFNNNGIPDIIVHFQQTFCGCYGGLYRIFRYVDGKYRMLEMVTFINNELLPSANFGSIHNLYIDDGGRIITFVNSEMPGMWYDHLVITDYRAEFHHIASANSYNWDAWQEHHWREWERIPYGYKVTDCWASHNPTIFGTDISIARLDPFTDLGTELYNYLQYKRQQKS